MSTTAIASAGRTFTPTGEVKTTYVVDDITPPRPKRYDVLAGIELAPAPPSAVNQGSYPIGRDGPTTDGAAGLATGGGCRVKPTHRKLLVIAYQWRLDGCAGEAELWRFSSQYATWIARVRVGRLGWLWSTDNADGLPDNHGEYEVRAMR
jgi:hypothetical protein